MADKEKKQYINKVKNRILSLSPSVREGLERECTKDDFYCIKIQDILDKQNNEQV